MFQGYIPAGNVWINVSKLKTQAIALALCWILRRKMDSWIFWVSAFGCCGVWSTIFSSASQALSVVVVFGQLFSAQRVRPFWSLWCLVNYFQFSETSPFGRCGVWSTIFSSASQALLVVVVFGQLFSVQRVRPFWSLWCLVNYFQFSEPGPFGCCGVWSTIFSSASQAPFGCCGVWSTIFSSASQALSVVVVFDQLFSAQRVRPFWSLWCLVNYFQFSETGPFGRCGVWSTIFSSASQALLVVVVFGQLFSVQRVRPFWSLWCLVNYFQLSESGPFGCSGVWSTIFSSASQAPFGCCGVWSTIFSSASQALLVVVVFGQLFSVQRVRPFRLLWCLLNYFQFSESGPFRLLWCLVNYFKFSESGPFGCCGVWSTIFSSASQALLVVAVALQESGYTFSGGNHHENMPIYIWPP